MLYAAAILIVIGVAMFVAAPLFEFSRTPDRPDSELNRLDHERTLAIAALRDLEFDRQMKKLSDEDWQDLHDRLETRALAAMAAIEKLRSERRTPAPQSRPHLSIPASKQREQLARFCPGCGAQAKTGANFCPECGSGLRLRERA